MSLFEINFEDACVEFGCERCGGTGQDPVRIGHDPTYCDGCGGSACEVIYIGTWLTNLATAAGLCRAWTVGFQAAALLHAASVHGYWRPGCRSGAP